MRNLEIYGSGMEWTNLKRWIVKHFFSNKLQNRFSLQVYFLGIASMHIEHRGVVSIKMLIGNSNKKKYFISFKYPER